MQQVIYASAALRPFSEAELAELLAAARANNERLGVTGMLLYDAGSFLQVLEGEPLVLPSLFEKIGRDKRHHRVVALLERNIEQRQFGEWRMGFASMLGATAALPGYSDYVSLRDRSLDAGHAAANVLLGFRAGRFHSFVR